MESITLAASSKLFVRHTATTLFYGTYTAVGDHGHHEWELRGISLIPNSRIASQPVQLVDFFGTDIGSTVAFEIFNGHFYAVSNQTSFDVEELDWTSFYHCVRFPLDRLASDDVDINTRVYRRQHAEGPIHDSWTDLTIQIDECTNEPVIVESRREWQNGSSRQLRTFYISDIKFNKNTTPDGEYSPDSGASNPLLLPEDDLFTTVLDSSNKPNYAPFQPRFASNFHPEFGQPGESGIARSFILARTKFRAYNYSCSSFIDLVEDDRCCSKSSAEPCFRIRVGSRRVAPLDWLPSNKAEASKAHADSLYSVTDKDKAYRHADIKMWPPPARCPCSDRLHSILNPKIGPGYGSRAVNGVIDERSLVYMVKPGRSYSADDSALGTVIVINFTRNHTKATVPSEMRIDSPTYPPEETKDLSPLTEWHWTPALRSLCRTGKCY